MVTSASRRSIGKGTEAIEMLSESKQVRLFLWSGIHPENAICLTRPSVTTQDLRHVLWLKDQELIQKLWVN